MYLKRVELLGFKSFADKVKVELKPGVTGIVGPNGTGKSNIVEGIRWCLGEMSWKSLRSDSMVDVIFNGTARRPPLNLAAITLVFDNASSMLPVDYSEVSVTRKIFRSGETGYYLNKAQCRLKDIRELFLDTGIGGDGYAIIDQGGVDFVLSSKPEERRCLFEEAAGVARYKAKREEALRKLERVETDMARLSDQVGMIVEQTRKLESDARKARLHQGYRDKLMALETAGLAGEISAARSHLEGVRSEAAPLKEDFENRRVDIEREEAEYASLGLEKAGQENAVVAFSQGLSDAKSEMGRLEERVVHAERMVESLKARGPSLAQEVERDRARAGSMRPELERTQEEASREKAVLSEIGKDFEISREAVSAMMSRVEALETERVQKEPGSLALSQERQDLSREMALVESDLQHIQLQAMSSLKEMEKEGEKLDRQVREMDDVLFQKTAAEERHSRQSKALAGMESRRSSIAADAERIGEEISEIRARKAIVEARLQALKEAAMKDPEWVAATAVLGAQIPGVLGMLRHLVDVEPGCRVAAEEVLGEALNAVVCRDVESAHEGIEFLKETGKGRARFIILSAVPERSQQPVSLPSGAQALLSRVRARPEAENLFRHLLGEVYTVGRTLHGSYWIQGGGESDSSARVHLKEDESLAGEVAGLERHESGKTSQKAALGEERSRLDADMGSAYPVFREEETALHSISAQAKEKKQLLEVLRQGMELAEKESISLLKEISLKMEERSSLRGKMNEIGRREEECSRQVADIKKRVDEGKAELNAENANLQVIETRKGHVQDQVARIEAFRDRLLHDSELVEGSLREKEAQILDCERSISEETRAREESLARLSSLRGSLAGLEEESRGFFDRLDDLRRLCQEKENVIREKKSRWEEVRQELHGREVRIAELETRQEVLRVRLWEEWQVSPEEAMEKYGDVESSPEAVQSLKAKIQRLGAVNLAAPEEYEALKSRRDFLAGQMEDLQKAKDDLKQAISKVNATTRENFRQTFEEVRENFRKLYGSLFDGGEADLVLTQPDNLLETGVDIVAEPPGKKLQSISLLSGGEKALTAIALLFAFFAVKPSPFCMLDEADAALDDANIERFLELLKNFSATTQFLIVSHNKRTMEAADVMYGVTMEEMGISQLVSVRMKKGAPAEDAAVKDLV